MDQHPAHRPDTADADDSLREARVGILYAQIPTATTTSALVALLTIAILWEVASPAALAAWGGSIFLVSSDRQLLAGRYRAAHDPDPRFWLRLYLVGTALAGGSWGALAVLLDPAWPATAQIGLLTMLAGVCAGAISNNGTHLAAYLAFLVPCIGPLVVRLATSGDPTLTMIGAAALLYGVGLSSIARPYSRAFAQAQILAREKGQLVDQLSAVNDDLSVEVLSAARRRSSSRGSGACSSRARSSSFAGRTTTLRQGMVWICETWLLIHFHLLKTKSSYIHFIIFTRVEIDVKPVLKRKTDACGSDRFVSFSLAHISATWIQKITHDSWR